MKRIKLLLFALAGVVVLLVVAGVVAFVFIDTLALHGVERGASYALGVDTTLDTADVGVSSGTFSMAGLDVANPEGFSSPHFLHLDAGGVDVSLGTLLRDTVELSSLRLDGVDVNLQRAGTESNYGVILDNLKRFEGSGTSAPGPTKGGKRFIIRTIEIRNVIVHADLAPIAGDLTRLDLPIDQITLTDVGSETNTGVLLSELAVVLVKAILTAVTQKAGGIFPDDMLGDLGAGLGGLASLGETGIGGVVSVGDKAVELTRGLGAAGEAAAGAAGGAVGEVRHVVENVSKGAGQAADKAKDALKGIGGLIPGAKKDDSKDEEKDKTKDDGGG